MKKCRKNLHKDFLKDANYVNLPSFDHELISVFLSILGALSIH